MCAALLLSICRSNTLHCLFAARDSGSMPRELAYSVPPYNQLRCHGSDVADQSHVSYLALRHQNLLPVLPADHGMPVPRIWINMLCWGFPDDIDEYLVWFNACIHVLCPIIAVPCKREKITVPLCSYTAFAQSILLYLSLSVSNILYLLSMFHLTTAL